MTIKPVAMGHLVEDGDREVAVFDQLSDAEHFCRMQWRPVSEKPGDEETVLVSVDGQIHASIYRADSDKFSFVDRIGWFNCTRWMPLPLAPKEWE